MKGVQRHYTTTAQKQDFKDKGCQNREKEQDSSQQKKRSNREGQEGQTEGRKSRWIKSKVVGIKEQENGRTNGREKLCAMVTKNSTIEFSNQNQDADSRNPNNTKFVRMINKLQFYRLKTKLIVRESRFNSPEE